MLAADKLQLQSTLRQQATALKEKEFNLHHGNLMTVGTQAAVLAGLDVTMFIEFQPPPNEEWAYILVPRALKLIYYVLITSAFCANIFVVGQTTVLSVLGASLALRGPDGSMMTATDGLYHERGSVFRAFGYGLILTMGSVVMCVWLHLHWEASILCCAIAVFTMSRMRASYHRVAKKFDFDESMTVDFRDIFDGPAAIQAIPISMWRGLGLDSLGAKVKNGIKGSTSSSSRREKDKWRGSGYDDEEEESFTQRQRRKSNVAINMV